jgi:hypothetical protein
VKKKMTNEETFKGDEKDLRGMMNALFSVLLPVGLLLTVLSAFIYSYAKFKWGGFLGCSLLLILIASVGESSTRALDNDQDEN